MDEYTKESHIGDLDVILHFEYIPPDPRDRLYPGADADVTLNAIQVGTENPIYFDDDIEDIFQDSVVRDLEAECLEWVSELIQGEYYDK